MHKAIGCMGQPAFYNKKTKNILAIIKLDC